MRQLGFIPVALLMTACAVSNPSETDNLSYVNDGQETNFWFQSEPKVEVVSYDINKSGLAPKADINILAEKIVNELVMQNDSLKPDQPLLVSTPVKLGNYAKTNTLGLQLQQGMVAAFHSHEFNLVDMNVANSLRATPTGEFILSRDWKQLPSDLPVSHVVVATMESTPQGVAINARIVNVTNNRVVSAMQTFVQMSSLPGFLMPANKVISIDGLLYRNEVAAMTSVNILGDRP